MHEAGRAQFDQDVIVRDLVRTLESTKRFDALGPDEVAQRIAGRERVIVEEGLLEVAVEKLHTGKGLYHQGLPDEALATLQAAVGDFMRAMPATNTVSDLWEAWVYIGTCHLQHDPPATTAARIAFQNAASLLPQRPLNPALFPPDVVEAYETERHYLHLFPLILDVRADGPATIWIDGVEHGRAPTRVEGLVPGEHHVVARGEGTLGYALATSTAPELVAGSPPASPRPPTFGEARLSLRLPVLGQALDSRVGRSQQTAALYLALANRAAGLDFVLLVGADEGVVHLQLLDARNESLSEPLSLPHTGDPGATAVAGLERLLDLVGEDTRLVRTVGAAVPLDVGANSRLAALLLLPQDFGSAPYQRARRRRRGVVAGVSAALAVVAAGAGTYAIVSRTNP